MTPAQERTMIENMSREALIAELDSAEGRGAAYRSYCADLNKGYFAWEDVMRAIVAYVRLRTPSPVRERAAADEIVGAGFLDYADDKRPEPNVFIQWKGTDVCMDFYCECGARCHFDGDFAYAVKCPHCETIWEMPCKVYPRKVCDRTYPGHIEMAKVLEHDEDYEDAEGKPTRVAAAIRSQAQGGRG